MKRFRLLIICTVLSVTFGMSSRAESNSKDEELIGNVITEMTAAFNRHDAREASRMYTADADFVTVRGARAKGASEIERQLAAIFATRAKDATLGTLDVTIRIVTPDVAVAHVTNELSGIVRPDGQKLPPHTELSIRVFVKADGVWKVVAFHNTIIAPF
jgi:uncharacterized protein (TIGR02246 family)